MTIKTEEGKDKGLPNWRVKIELHGDTINLYTKNFDMGFWSNESWDKIGYTKNGSDKYENWVSVITKDKSKLEGYKPLIINKFYEILEYNKSIYIKEQKRISSRINDFDNYLNSDIFKDRIRDDKLNEILE